jgi:hypothetical protein
LGKSFSNEPRSRTSRAGAIRTIGITRARIKIGMANLAFRAISVHSGSYPQDLK